MLSAFFGGRVIVKHGALTPGFQFGQFLEAGGQSAGLMPRLRSRS
jgi:hypothetical protein